MSFGSSTIILLDHREDKCFTGQCSQKIKQVPYFFLNKGNDFFFKDTHNDAFVLCIYILNQHMTKYFETAQHRLAGVITVFPSSIRNLGREAFSSPHISVSLSDTNIQRILHSNSCNFC